MSGVQNFRCGLIGWPVAHSLSPRIHQAAFRAAGLTGEYLLYPVDPANAAHQFAGLLTQLRSGEISGLNVTVPYKEAIVSMVAKLSETAHAVGAVNTLYTQNHEILGENSDAAGFLRHIARLGLLKIPKGQRCVILGAGGAARAVAYALSQAGHEVFVSARRVEQAAHLVEELNRSLPLHTPLQMIAFDPLKIRQLTPVLLLNATPLGMQPDTHRSPWPENIPLPDRCAVYDLIYNPLQTTLLNQAHREGLIAANGLGMLVEQAAISFSIWTGVQPPLEPLYQEVGLPFTEAID